jgi:hypothetical protein
MPDSIRIEIIETVDEIAVTVVEQNRVTIDISEGGTGGGAWGEITGTLSDQTDLQNELDGKSATSHNHVLNNLSEKSYNSLADKPIIPDELSDLLDDSTHRTVTDTEKSIWNAKQNALGFTPENVANIITSFQITPDDTHYPSEKLVKDQLDLKLSAGAASLYITPANPASLTNNLFRMFGLGASTYFTPLKSGKVKFNISFFPSGVGTAGTNSFKLCWGTGAAPANGTAASGNVVGRTDAGGTAIAIAGTPAPIVREITVTGLTLNTQIWFDIQGAKNSGNSAVGMGSIEINIQELTN